MGDVSVNKKMKILTDSLRYSFEDKFQNENEFKINKKLILKYFKD